VLCRSITGTSAKSDGLTPFRHATLTYQKYFGFVLPKWCILVAAQLCDARPKIMKMRNCSDLAVLLLSLSQPCTGATAVLVDELDAYRNAAASWRP
jgi:hypothetical protein